MVSRGRSDAAERVEAAWSRVDVCRNCGVLLDTAHCGACGQKAAKRLTLRDTGKEAWERLRFFELKSARTLGWLIRRPGGVARDYVLGKRSDYLNPLTLLIALVAILVLVLAASRYFAVYSYAGANGDVDRMAQRVMAWANWSFSLGIFAIFAASATVFWQRCGYNLVEHAVLAIYCQCLILAVIVVNLLPTLVWSDAAFVLRHKAASQYYLYAIKLLIVAVAFRQFFVLDLRRDWPRLVAACGVFAAFSWVLLRLYASFILWIVSR